MCWHLLRTVSVNMMSRSVGATFRIICQTGCVLSFRLKLWMWSVDTFTGSPMFGGCSASTGQISVRNKKESQHFCQPNKRLLSLCQRWFNSTSNLNSWLDSSLVRAVQTTIKQNPYWLIWNIWYWHQKDVCNDLTLRLQWPFCRHEPEWWFYNVTLKTVVIVVVVTVVTRLQNISMFRRASIKILLFNKMWCRGAPWVAPREGQCLASCWSSWRMETFMPSTALAVPEHVHML